MFALVAVFVAGTLAVDNLPTKHFRIWTRCGFWVAYLCAELAVICLVGAIREWDFPFARRHTDQAAAVVRPLSAPLPGRLAPVPSGTDNMRAFFAYQQTIKPTDLTFTELKRLLDMGNIACQMIPDRDDVSVPGFGKEILAWNSLVEKELAGYPSQLDRFMQATVRLAPANGAYSTDAEPKAAITRGLAEVARIISELEGPRPTPEGTVRLLLLEGDRYRFVMESADKQEPTAENDADLTKWLSTSERTIRDLFGIQQATAMRSYRMSETAPFHVPDGILPAHRAVYLKAIRRIEWLRGLPGPLEGRGRVLGQAVTVTHNRNWTGRTSSRGLSPSRRWPGSAPSSEAMSIQAATITASAARGKLAA